MSNGQHDSTTLCLYHRDRANSADPVMASPSKLPSRRPAGGRSRPVSMIEVKLLQPSQGDMLKKGRVRCSISISTFQPQKRAHRRQGRRRDGAYCRSLHDPLPENSTWRKRVYQKMRPAGRTVWPAARRDHNLTMLPMMRTEGPCHRRPSSAGHCPSLGPSG